MNARDTSICKFLHAWLAPRAAAILSVPFTLSAGLTVLFFNTLQFSEKMAVGSGLAHRLQHLPAYGYGYQSSVYGSSGAEGDSTTQPSRWQAPRDRGCAPASRIDHARVRCGTGIFGSAQWQYATRTGIAGFERAATWTRENVVGCSSGVTC